MNYAAEIAPHALQRSVSSPARSSIGRSLRSDGSRIWGRLAALRPLDDFECCRKLNHSVI